tara:strand:- start:978 stop:1193 length:216 start_codon:yes stop_codon:yes gene_type:complete
MTQENKVVVDEKNADFLWHSNEALKKALEKKERELNKLKTKTNSFMSLIKELKKELQKMEMKWHDCYWNKR